MLMSRSGATEKIAAIDAGLIEKERLRTETGRDRKRLGDLGKAPAQIKHPSAIDDVRAERENMRKHQKAYAKAQTAAQETIRRALNDCCTFEDLENVASVIAGEVAAGRKKLAGFKAYTEADAQALDEQISQWFDIEGKARIYDVYLEKKNQCEALDRQYEALTTEIEGLRSQRKKVLSEMDLRVAGLEINEASLLVHNGIVRGVTKIEKAGNWSTAESVQVFFGLGARFAGKMKVLVVDNAESLDTKTTGAITEWAEKAGFMVIMLRVAEVPEELEEGVIYIREGEVLTK
jgi:hypothetical protein